MTHPSALHEDLSRSQHAESSSDRAFGLVFAVVFCVVALFPLLRGGEPLVWAWAGAAAFLLVALARPALLAPLNRLWLKVGALLHRIVSPLVLGLVFYGVVLPTGLAMRLVGRRPLHGDFDGRDSFWVHRDPPGPAPEGMKNQF